MKVNYNYLEQEFSKPNQIIEEWRKLIKSTDFTLGKYVAKFENSSKIYWIQILYFNKQWNRCFNFMLKSS